MASESWWSTPSCWPRSSNFLIVRSSCPVIAAGYAVITADEAPKVGIQMTKLKMG